MEALPLLVVAASPLRPLGRLTLVVWAVGSSVNLLAALTETNVLHSPRQGGAAGFGLVLAVLAFAAVAEKAWRGAEFSRASRMPPPDPAPASR
jgi:hypothetical protein